MFKLKFLYMLSYIFKINLRTKRSIVRIYWFLAKSNQIGHDNWRWRLRRGRWRRETPLRLWHRTERRYPLLPFLYHWQPRRHESRSQYHLRNPLIVWYCGIRLSLLLLLRVRHWRRILLHMREIVLLWTYYHHLPRQSLKYCCAVLQSIALKRILNFCTIPT